MSKLTQFNRPQKGIALAVQEIGTQIKDRGAELAGSDVTSQLISLESFNEQSSELASLHQNYEEARRAVREAFDPVALGFEGTDDLTDAQIDSGAIALMASGNPASYAEYAYRKSENVSVEGINVIEPESAGPHGSRDYRLVPSMESFNESEISEHLPFSIAFNVQAARQDTFSEAFYPTIVCTPDQAGLDVNVKRATVFNEIRREQSGKVTDWGRENLIDALTDAGILSNETTKATPVVIDAGENVNTDKFIDASLYAPQTIERHGVTITTAPLRPGVEFDLLGISQNEALVGAGVMDHTDDLDARLGLDRIYVKTVQDNGADPDVVDLIPFQVQRLPRAHFVKTVEGRGREMSLHFQSDDLLLDPNQTTTVNGAVPAFLAAGTYIGDNNLRVVLGARVTGDVDVEFGHMEVHVAPMKVRGVYNEDGDRISIADNADLQTEINDLEAGLEVAGYTLEAYRTNANRRTRGLLIDTLTYTERYTIPMGAPISTPRPVALTNDGNEMAALITAARVRNSNNAVTSLLNYAETLNEYARNYAFGKERPEPQMEGLGRFLVKPFYDEHNIHLPDVINSIRSVDRAEDLQGALVDAVREMAYRAARDSGYLPALESMTGMVGEKPRIVIGTDPLTVQHLMIHGDTRLGGVAFDHQVAASTDTRVYGKIFVTFARANQDGPDPLSFGNHAWIPELTSTVNVSRGGATTREAMVQPRSRHINHLPILGVINVTGIEEVLTTAAAGAPDRAAE